MPHFQDICPWNQAACAVDKAAEKSLATLLKKAAKAHHKFEAQTGKPDKKWPLWYAKFILEQGFTSATNTPVTESPVYINMRTPEMW